MRLAMLAVRNSIAGILDNLTLEQMRAMPQAEAEASLTYHI